MEHAFLYPYLGGAGLWLLLCSRILILLHAPDLKALEIASYDRRNDSP